MRVSDGSSISYLNGNTYMASVVNNVLYYIDLDNNYALTSVNLSNNTKKVLTTDKVVLYNVYNDVIYYQEETYDHSFNRMNKDGSNQIKIYDGDITSISCTSKYTFSRCSVLILFTELRLMEILQSRNSLLRLTDKILYKPLRIILCKGLFLY